jgi:hypothetical protein
MKSVFACFVMGTAMLATSAVAQVRQFVGTVSALKPETAEIVVKPDTGDAVSAKVSGTTVAQRIAPGEKDLKKAEAVTPGDVAVGDRVLVALEPGTTDLRRIVIMSATDIKSKNEKDRQEWVTRGISGVVTEKKGDTLTLKLKVGGVEKVATVTVASGANLKRYAPDSVKFTDAKTAKLAEMAVGDQVRARGEKSADGLAVKADELVFGTFQTRAGSIVSVDAATKELTVKELGSEKTFTVKVTGESQVKALPDFGGMGGDPGGPGGAPGGMPGGRGPMAGGGAPGGGAPGGMPGGRGGMPDVNQMIETMPLATIEALKPGQSIIVSSTKSAKPDQLTAITLVGNAGMIIRMAQASAAMAAGGPGGGRGQGGPGGQGMGGGMGQGMGGAMGGMGGFDLSGMTP